MPTALAIKKRLPGAIPLSDFAGETVQMLGQVGFAADRCLAIFCRCRHAGAEAPTRALQAVWPRSLDVPSLGGAMTLGRTGVRSLLGPFSGVERIVAFTILHLGVERAADTVSLACCDAIARAARAAADDYVPRGLPVGDIEYAALAQALFRGLPGSDPVEPVALSERAGEVLSDASMRVLDHSLEARRFDVAVVTAIHVHGEGTDLAVPTAIRARKEGRPERVRVPA